MDIVTTFCEVRPQVLNTPYMKFTLKTAKQLMSQRCLPLQNSKRIKGVEKSTAAEVAEDPQVSWSKSRNATPKTQAQVQLRL